MPTIASRNGRYTTKQMPLKIKPVLIAACSLTMKPMIIVGILLIVLGGVALAYQGVSYTKREKVIDFGPLEVSSETKKTIPLPPILGGLAIAGGIALVVVGSKNNS